MNCPQVYWFQRHQVGFSRKRSVCRKLFYVLVTFGDSRKKQDVYTIRIAEIKPLTVDTFQFPSEITDTGSVLPMKWLIKDKYLLKGLSLSLSSNYIIWLDLWNTFTLFLKILTDAFSTVFSVTGPQVLLIAVFTLTGTVILLLLIALLVLRYLHPLYPVVLLVRRGSGGEKKPDVW